MQPRSSDNALGIDVSNWQGAIDWPTVARGIAFAFIKATEGVGYTDPSFADNMSVAKAAGVLRGPYHFATPDHGDALSEAQYFCDTVEANGGWGELPPGLDLEKTNITGAELVQWVNDWMDYVEKRAGKQPILYVSPAFYDQHLGNTTLDCGVWVADWGTAAPLDFGGFTGWTFWQYTNGGTITGISGRVDLDVYCGTVEQLKRDFDAGAKPSSKTPSQTGGVDVQTPLLKQGVTGHDSAVKAVQGAVGAEPVDGVFGTKTLSAVQTFQRKNGLQPDGEVGPLTWRKILA